MKNLIEISKIVTKKKVKKIEIFDDHSLKHKNSKFNEFYEALMIGKFKNDRDAASFLYGCSPTDDKYRQLKSRFRKRLLNTLFFLDVNLPSTSGYDRAYFSCNKDWTLVRILLSNEANHTAASLAKQILTTALKFKFADVIVNCSRILRRYAVSIEDEKAYELYDQYSKQYQNVLDAEIRSEELYQRVIMNYYKPATKNHELEQKIDVYCDALVGLSEMYDSPIVIYNTFQMKKMSAFLHLKDYKNGKVNAEKCLQSFPEGSETWFNFMQYYLLLALHTENYINALAIYKKATNNTKFKRLSLGEKEVWRVYDIYLNYIIESQGERNPILKMQKRRKFRLSRFLNDPVLYPKDQRVFTILLVVAQLLFFLEKKSYSAATERIDRLKGYANRQLKKEVYHRAINFIRLLQQLAKADYQPKNLSNTDKYFVRLEEEPFKYRGLISEIEVIPYEHLWNMILERLR